MLVGPRKGSKNAADGYRRKPWPVVDHWVAKVGHGSNSNFLSIYWCRRAVAARVLVANVAVNIAATAAIVAAATTTTVISATAVLLATAISTWVVWLLLLVLDDARWRLARTNCLA